MISDLLDMRVKEEIKSNTQNLSIDKWTDTEKLGKLRREQYQ